jgi:hypothetical protein
MKRQPCDWIITKQEDLATHCTRCGMTLRLQLPVDLKIYIDANQTFIRTHKNCPEPAQEPADADTP